MTSKPETGGPDHKQQIDLRGIAQRDGSSFEPVTSELGEEQLSNVSGGKGGTKAPPVRYLVITMKDVIISSY
jgi:hypothetical protein